MITKRPLGRTGIDVSVVGFGASGLGNLGYPVDEETGRAAVDRAWDAGVRLFDTAPHYGLGLSESRLGRALRDRGRDEYVISTKVGRLLRPNPDPVGSDLGGGGFAVPDDLTRVWDLSADGVRRSLEESLGRLGLDRVDIVYVHDPDDAVDEAIAHAIPALVRLREEGVIGAVGVGMNQWQAPLRMVRETDLDVVMLAGRWTLLDRSGEPLLEECARRDVAVVAAAPYNSGILARPWPADGANYDYGTAPEVILTRARSLAKVCEHFGSDLPTAAVQFPLRHPAVATVVAGMRSARHVDVATTAVTATLPDALWRELG
jgi:D-threo-aldose 1-dehydrogenase